MSAAPLDLAAYPRVHMLPSAAVEPGDLLLGPHLPAPARVWWRLDAPGQSTVLLAGPEGADPIPVRLDPAGFVTIAERRLLGPAGADERASRLLFACRGSAWLIDQGHPAAPPKTAARMLLQAYAQLAGLDVPGAHTRVRAAMPPPPGHTLP